MRIALVHTARLAVLFAIFFGARPTTRAEAPSKIRTQKVSIRLPYIVLLSDPVPSIELVQIPAGKIVLTDAAGKPTEHAIKSIWVARYETRWNEYDVFWQALDLTIQERQKLPYDRESRERRTTRPFSPPEGGYDPDNFQFWESPGHDGFPANCIGFEAARRYCAWLSKHTGKKFRLPTEAEWEYACRAGGPPLKPDSKALDDVAWFAENAGNKTHAVGKKQPNAWGLYDMLGNVGEYVIRDPKDDKGLLAGGSYKDDARRIASDAREPYSKHDWQRNDEQDPPDPDWLNWTVHHVGFRVVMED